MKLLTFTLLFLSYSLPVLPSEPIYLCRGKSQVIKNTSHIRISEKGILSLKQLPNAVRVTGLKRGEVSINGNGKKINVYVTSCKIYKLLALIQNRIQNHPSLKVSVHNKLVHISGELLVFNDWLSLLQDNPSSNLLRFTTVQSHKIKLGIASYVDKIASENNLPLPTISTSPVLKILIAREQKKYLKQYKKIFIEHGLPVEITEETIARKKLVKIKILATEIKKNSLSNIGLEWPTEVKFQIAPKINGLNNEIFVNAKLFEQSGAGNILASPTLLTESGKQADFHSGGEFAVKVSNQIQTGVTWKKYGIILKILPIVDNANRISLEISCEISSIDASQSVDGIPALSVHRISSKFNLDKPRTIALSGIIQKVSSNSRSGIAGLYQIPLLKELFSSKQYLQNESEFMIFVTPQIEIFDAN